MKRLIGAAATGLWLAGCVAGPQGTAGKADIQQRQQELAAARQACAQRYGHRWTARARCVNEAEDRTLKAEIQYPDLYARNQALRVEIAAKQERHELTEEEAQRRFTEAYAELQSEGARRQTAGRVAARP